MGVLELLGSRRDRTRESILASLNEVKWSIYWKLEVETLVPGMAP